MEFNTAAWLNISFGFGVLFTGLILFEVSRQLPDSIHGGKTWAYGNLLLFVGLILFGLRDVTPEFLPVLVGNTLVITATLFFFQAFNKVLGTQSSPTPGHVILGASLIGLAYFLFVNNDYGIRVIIVSVALMVTTGMSFALFIPLKSHEMNSSRRMFGFTYLMVLIMFTQRIAVVLLNRDKDAAFFDSNPHILTSLILLSAIVIVMSFSFVLLSNVQNYLKIHKLAYLDELTQTYSRRAILDYGSASINQSKRSLIPFSLLLVDLDDLKVINDQHGHLAGDQALITISSTIKHNLREEDAIGRYGGDEFIIILRNTNLKGAEHTVIRLISELDKANQTAAVEAYVSIGVCQYTPGEGNFNDVLHRADQALYSSKHTEGNSYNICNRQDTSASTTEQAD